MRRLTGPRLAFVVVALAAVVFAAAPASAQGVGELRERADRLVRDVLGQHSTQLLVEDLALGRVATWMAAQGLRQATPAATVRHRLWAEDVRDFEFLPLVVVADAGGDPVAALEPLLRDRGVRWGRYNSVSVAASRLGQRRSIAVLLSRRAAAFVDDGHLRREEDLVRLSGEYAAPVLYVTRPDGLVERRTPRPDGDVWRLDVSVPFDGGWLFELMADGPTGPEVLALWPVTQTGTGAGAMTQPRDRGDDAPAVSAPGGPPDPTSQFPDSGPVAWTPYDPVEEEDQRDRAPPLDSAAWVEGSGPGPDRAPTAADARAAEDRLWDLIAATRAARGLDPLKRDAAITNSARDHARELIVQPFGHETTSGTALDRLGAVGLTAARATENIARAADVAEAHAALMASPSHRANILDADVSSAGVGVVLVREPSGRWSAMVAEVFASLLKDDGTGTTDWPRALADRIDAKRQATGREKLVRRDTISEMAHRAAKELIESGELRLTPERRKELAEEVRFHFINARNVGIDLVVTAEPRADEQLKHVTDERYTELGLAVVRLPARVGDHAAGALVVVLIFVER